MARLLTFPLVAFLALATILAEAGEEKKKDKPKDFSVKGKLTADDPKDQERKGPVQTHVVPLKAGISYSIEMRSGAFDTWLRLLDPKGNQLDEDDDGGGGTDSLIIFNCTKDGDYKIVTTTFGEGAAGDYTLLVKVMGAVQKPASAQVRMIGKPAPDFRGDFTVNGKSESLSDLKGSVVLLYFWEVRSSSSAALLPTLDKWHKTYKKDGLEIVGATFYTSDIGQKLGWDSEEGKVTTAKQADRKSDQALLKTYAEFHKIEHRLLALPKKDAHGAFDIYLVDTLPQIVLIDRKGTLRFIDINGEKGAASVESELKKLLAEKSGEPNTPDK